MSTDDSETLPRAPEQSQEVDRPKSLEIEQQLNGNPPDAKPASQAFGVSVKARDLTSRALDFLSNASNETLGACVVALAASTWLVLGRLGLLIIGIVGGVVLHATWEGDRPGQVNDEARAAEARKRREKGLEIVARVLDWRESRDTEENADSTPEQLQKLRDFSRFRPETRAALTGLTDAVIRDYVRWWYSPVLPSEIAFPLACRHTLTGFLVSVSSYLSRKRPADTFLDFLTNSSSIVIVFLSELSGALKASTAPSDVSNAIQTYLEVNPSSSLSNVLDAEQQKRKLQVVAEDILKSFLEPKAYACAPVRIFLREILSGVILDMTVTSCSRPEFINDWIIYSLEEGSTEILDAIDAGVGGATANGNSKGASHASDSTASNGQQILSETPEASLHAKSEHKRTVSRAEDAMEEAMQEAKRLSELIAAEEAKKAQPTAASSFTTDDNAIQTTPISPRDEHHPNADESTLLAADQASAHEIPRPTTGDVEPNTPAQEAIARSESKIAESSPSFTTFDQIIGSQKPTALDGSSTQSYTVPPMTLFNASVSIFDDSLPNEKVSIRSKPTVEYLLQIEPSTSQYPGWMIARKYPDFETLHEVLRRISVISGVALFAERHQTLPAWKGKTKTALRSELEHYLRDALSFQRLAESEGMKRFLEKDQGLGGTSPGTNKGGFGFPSPAAFETMGKGMLDVLTSTPKGAATGGKAILGGMSGVLGGVGTKGQKKQSSSSSAPSRSTHTSKASLPLIDSTSSPRQSLANGRTSLESLHRSVNSSTEDLKPPLPRRQSQRASEQYDSAGQIANGSIPEEKESTNATRADPSFAQLAQCAEHDLHLPPPPSEISDDYNVAQISPRHSLSNDDNSTIRTPTSTAPATLASPSRTSISSFPPIESESESAPPPPKPSTRKTPTPLTSQETSVAVELFFATINELYTLSSAWTLRLTLLNAAKSFLLRPGNPNLESIRLLLQETIIDANTTDTGIATHLLKLRENSLPTEEELKAWPPPPSEDAKERMRIKARKLLVEKGMPQALTSVMGAAASGEALGRVFDCLQVPEVARGLVFALVLQGVRAVTQ